MSTDLLDRLPADERDLLLRCGELAAERGERAYLVGGSVRDLLLGHPQDDLDVVVEGDGMAVAQALARAVGAKLTRHHAFQTARVDVTEGLHVDVATARREDYPKPGQLPQVVPGTLHEDLERRDFSINTLVVSLSGDEIGGLLDPMQGQEALREQRVSVLHERSFADDPTRILRALRFSLRFGYRLGERTAAQLGEAIKGAYLDLVSGDRIRRELALMFSEAPVEGPLRLQDEGVLAALYDGLRADRPLLEALARNVSWYEEHRGDVPPDERPTAGWPLVLACCGVDLASQSRWDLARHLRLSREERRPLIDAGLAWNRAMETIAAPSRRPAAASEVERAFRDIGPGALLVGAATAGPDSEASDAVCRYLAELRTVRPHLDGGALCQMGVPEGPMIGEMLDDLLAARLDGDTETADDERRLVAAWMAEKPQQ